MNEHSKDKFGEIASLLSGQRILVAFSGGVDSSVLALLAKKHGERVVLLTVDSILSPQSELANAKKVADELNIESEIIHVNHLEDNEFTKNPRDRCYLCKKKLSSIWIEFAEKQGLDMVVEGTSASDLKGHRPGERALREMGGTSPFLDAGITKDEIRKYAKENGLSVADRPSMACLATRFPYGVQITKKHVNMVDAIEQAVRRIFEVHTIRARFHGDLVRIEVGSDERDKLFDSNKLDELNELAKSIGFTYVAIDAKGYRTGAMDELAIS
ncbi:MAG: ATP-dependent sacrificial sulfur transferase LarE [Candidatus Thorarchaeota archaeon]|nr:ATP-dependent sacrificial sulfur transferase LarE [Candidatus Thorarchaeota archaeon]